jgi:hypothetical protein
MVILLLSESGAAFAHIGSVVYPFFELPTSELPSLHDGTLDDWDAVLPHASLTHTSFTQPGSSDPVDVSSLAWRAFLAWHSSSQFIFVAFERIDDLYIPAQEDLFQRERIEFSVDADHSGGRFAFLDQAEFTREEQARLWNASAQTYMLKPEPFTEQGLQVNIDGGARPWVTQNQWTEVGGFHDGGEPNHSVIEARLTPWDDLNWQGADVSLRSSLRPNATIGFQILVYDNDIPGGRGGHVYSLHFGETFQQSHADFFVDGQLIPCSTADCSQASGTAVEGSSWARIKSSLVPD